MEKRKQVRPFMLRLTEEVFQKASKVAMEEGRSVTNLLTFIVTKHIKESADKGK